MSLSAGEKLGPYEILAPIGKGGMGEVYRACDTRLNRDVAIKISAERFTERFEREARAIASLNHPNICHLYDVGPNYLVMELVEGPTLADRIKQGGIPLEEALNIACQIADALEAAHEKGITHRDLKPGNINIKPDGTVKVLDFGLAKMGGTPTVQSDHSPTITVNHTEAGVILGTAAYMSPEQAKGKPVDQRADIYAFGAVLYEMLTHTRLHHGETTTEVLASVIKEEPRWDKVPAQVRRLLRRCLEKDPQKRLRHIGDVMALLDDEVAAPSSVAAQPARKARRIWPSIAALLFVGSVFVFIHFHETPRTALEPVRFKIPLPEKTSLVPSGAFSVSPDGRKVVFAAGGPDGTRQLWVRTLDSLEAHPLPGVEIGNPPPPFWSPDSRFVAYNSGGKLNKVDVAGGPPQALCDLPANTLGGSWNRDGVIIFGTTQGLMRVSAAGGAAAAITGVDASRKDFAHIYPTFLPDGKHFLYLRYSADPTNSGVYVGSLDAKATEQSTKQLVATEYGPVYAPSMDGGTGHLLFLRQNVLMAQPLNERRLELAGDPVPVADQIGVSNGIRWGYFSVSANGVLLHRGGVGGQELQLTWFDRQGKVIGTVGEPGRYNTVFLSPDLKQAVVGQIDPQTSNDDLWILDLSKGTSTRFTFDPAPDTQPAWSPDSSQIAFFSSRSAGSGHLPEGFERRGK